jgi:hypothetical protein
MDRGPFPMGIGSLLGVDNMAEAIYRFQVHFSTKRGDSHTAKFVADIRPRRHGILRLRIETMIEMSLEKFRTSPITQREVFFDLWNAWEVQNKKLASTLPAKFPQKIYALKKLRQKEFGFYSNPRLMVELWAAWSRQNPREADKIERRVKKKESQRADIYPD